MKRFIGNRIVRAAVVAACLGAAFLPEPLAGQVRSGGAFLKLLPGARQHGLGAAYTGAIDEAYALFANPAASGWLREWQWAAAYNRWIADTYNLSWIYARQVRTPLHRKVRLAAGLHYQGVGAFNSTGDAQLSTVSASDLLFTLNMSTPLRLKVGQLALGGSVKYLRSALAGFDADAWMVDFGSVYRSPRFVLGLGGLEYGTVSAGVSVTNLGQPLTFVSETTPLPRTVRAGLALHLGAHHGVQLQVAADYVKVRSEPPRFGLGAEVAWSYRYAVRLGYRTGSELFSHLTAGVGLNLDGLWPFGRSGLLSRNKALRGDFAYLEGNEFFAPPLRFGVTHYPVGPEHFEVVAPNLGATTDSAAVQLAWSIAEDPDLYDEVAYLLLLDRTAPDADSSAALNHLVREVEGGRASWDALLERLGAELYLMKPLTETACVLDSLPGGRYFWAVLAYDRDRHARFAEKNQRKIWDFRVLPDLEITRLTFDPHPWVTPPSDSIQGTVRLTVRNRGGAVSDSVTLVVRDSVVTRAFAAGNGHTRNGTADRVTKQRGLATLLVPPLLPGDSLNFQLKWETGVHGVHELVAVVDRDGRLVERSRHNNRRALVAHTIPKGRFFPADPVVEVSDQVVQFTLPFFHKVFFDAGSAEVRLPESPLVYRLVDSLAVRLRDHPDATLVLQGAVDADAGEPESLAAARAEAVRRYLVREIGLDTARVQTCEAVVFDEPVRPSPDAERVREERRFVRIEVQDATGRPVWDVFASAQVQMPKATPVLDVPFVSTIRGAVPLDAGASRVYLEAVTETDAAEVLSDSLEFGLVQSGSDTVLSWQGARDMALRWADHVVRYDLELRDRLGRTFRTPPGSLLLLSEPSFPRVVIGSPDFRATETPASRQRWRRLARALLQRREQYSRVVALMAEFARDGADLHPGLSVRLRVAANACGIGTPEANQRLTDRRIAFIRKRLFARAREDELVARLLSLCDGGLVFESNGESKPFQIEVDSTAFFRALSAHAPAAFHKVQQALRAGRRVTLPPFVLELDTHSATGNGLVRLIADNDTPYGRQVNRRTEFIFEAQPRGLTVKGFEP